MESLFTRSICVVIMQSDPVYFLAGTKKQITLREILNPGSIKDVARLLEFHNLIRNKEV